MIDLDTFRSGLALRRDNARVGQTMKCRSSALALALTAVALLISLAGTPRPDPLPELCTERVEGELRRFEEVMHLPPTLTANDIAARKQIKASLISACINEALRRASAKP